jgi:hypothetical protein
MIEITMETMGRFMKNLYTGSFYGEVIFASDFFVSDPDWYGSG